MANVIRQGEGVLVVPKLPGVVALENDVWGL
jgi:hypothetical protein